MYPAVEIVPYKRNTGAGFFDSEHDLTFDPSSAVSFDILLQLRPLWVLPFSEGRR